MNKVCLIGRLTRNPELRYTQTQKAVATFTLAINRPVASDGQKRYVTEVIAEAVQFLEKKKEQPQQVSFQNQTNCQVFNQAMNDNSNPFEEFGEQIQMGNPDLPF